MQGLKWTFRSPPFFSKTWSHILHTVGKTAWGKEEKEGKSLNWMFSFWAFRGKRVCADGDVILEMRFQCRVPTGRRSSACLPTARGRARRCSRCDGRAHSPQHPGPGTPVENHPEHQMAHQRGESNFSHGIASGSSIHCQFKVVSLPNWLLFSARVVVVFFP